MASTRLTKKCFEIMDRAEIRRIAMIGMGLPPKEAYCLDHKGIISWVYTNAKGFADVDLGAIKKSKSGKESFRPGVVTYLVQLQRFILKEADKPDWPPVTGTEESVDEVVDQIISATEGPTEEEEEAVVVDTGVDLPAPVEFKKKSFKPKIYPKQKLEASPAEVEKLVPALPAPASPEVSEAVDAYLHKQVTRTADRMDYVSKALSEIKQKSFERDDELKKQLKNQLVHIHALEDQVLQISNALMFVVNTVCLGESSPVCVKLDSIPKPEDY